MPPETATKRRWFTRKSEDRALTTTSVPPVMLTPTASGQVVNTETAMALSDVYAAVRVLSTSAAGLPLHLYRNSLEGRTRFEGRAADLMRHPAPATTGPNLISQVMAHLALHGESFVGKYRSDGEVVQLGLLDPARVTVELMNSGEPAYLYRDPEGRETRLTPLDVVHIRGLSLDGIRGASPIRWCREGLGLSSALAEHGARFFSNGAAPGGVLSVKQSGPAAGDLMESLAKAWDARHRGAANAHRVAVVSGEVSFVPLSVPPADAEWIEARKASTVEVARIFGLPPWMLAADSGESMTYSNVTEQAAAFVKFALTPWLSFIESALSADPDLTPASCYWQFKVDGLLRGSASERADIYTKALHPDTGWLTRAEVRELEDLPREEVI